MPAPKGHPPYPGCETGGRPRKWTEEIIEEMAKKFEAWMRRSDSIWYEDFCLEEGLLPRHLAEWAKINEKFKVVYEKSQIWQKSKLVKGGLSSEFNSGFTKFVMSNTCGWREKSETTVIGDATNPLAFILKSTDGETKELISTDIPNQESEDLSYPYYNPEY